jgi:membrane protein DedA with SNARE-associated domain
LPDISLASLIAIYGYWAIFIVVMLESAGVPLPGETILVAASIYAGTTEQLDIKLVVFAAAAGAIIGDSVGYWIGRKYGFNFLLDYGHYVGLREPRLKLGQYLFLKYGGAIIFFGRFVATLRMFAALLAGANQFPWKRFLIFNATGGVVWAALFGFGAYIFGETLQKLTGPLAILMLIVGVIAVVLATLAIKRREKSLIADAEKAFPGPLRFR